MPSNEVWYLTPLLFFIAVFVQNGDGCHTVHIVYSNGSRPAVEVEVDSQGHTIMKSAVIDDDDYEQEPKKNVTKYSNIALPPNYLGHGDCKCGREVKVNCPNGDDTCNIRPWMARITIKDQVTGEATERCHGSLINKNMILSVAHCFCSTIMNCSLSLQNKTKTLKEGQDLIQISVIMGQEAVSMSERIKVNKIIIHKSYYQEDNQKGRSNDIAILVMNSTVDYMPICLPPVKPHVFLDDLDCHMVFNKKKSPVKDGWKEKVLKECKDPWFLIQDVESCKHAAEMLGYSLGDYWDRAWKPHGCLKDSYGDKSVYFNRRIDTSLVNATALSQYDEICSNEQVTATKEVMSCHNELLLPGALTASSAIDCQIGNGKDYVGIGRSTKSGLPCQNWSSQSPHDHKFTEVGDHNSCRNPDGESGVWCYTTRPDWEYCGIPSCDVDCQKGKSGKNYVGNVNKTKSGFTCKNWMNTIWSHVGNHSFCRNPYGNFDAWCYTTSPQMEWDYCDVPICGHCKKGNGINYEGTVHETKSGLTCQKWSSQTPHRHIHNKLGDHNYCRNPNGDTDVWCLTTSPRWDYCDVQVCGVLDDVMEEHTQVGVKSVGGTPTDGQIYSNNTIVMGVNDHLENENPKINENLWGPEENCASGHFAKQLRLKIDNYREDRTGLNAIQLICDDGKVLTSEEGKFGEFERKNSNYTCSAGNYIVGIKVREQEYQADLKDDTALNGLEFKCSDREWNNFWLYSPGSGKLGNWSTFGYCQKGYAIAGLSTYIIPDLKSPTWLDVGWTDTNDYYDDVSMTHVNFTCKKIPVPVQGISCGAHKAEKCSMCHQGNAENYCHGDCTWIDNQCISKTLTVYCGGHLAANCSQCPKKYGAKGCHGDCTWMANKCISRSTTTVSREKVVMETKESFMTTFPAKKTCMTNHFGPRKIYPCMSECEKEKPNPSLHKNVCKEFIEESGPFYGKIKIQNTTEGDVICYPFENTKMEDKENNIPIKHGWCRTCDLNKCGNDEEWIWEEHWGWCDSGCEKSVTEIGLMRATAKIKDWTANDPDPFVYGYVSFQLRNPKVKKLGLCETGNFDSWMSWAALKRTQSVARGTCKYFTAITKSIEFKPVIRLKSQVDKYDELLLVEVIFMFGKTKYKWKSSEGKGWNQYSQDFETATCQDCALPSGLNLREEKVFSYVYQNCSIMVDAESEFCTGPVNENSNTTNFIRSGGKFSSIKPLLDVDYAPPVIYQDGELMESHQKCEDSSVTAGASVWKIWTYRDFGHTYYEIPETNKLAVLIGLLTRDPNICSHDFKKMYDTNTRITKHLDWILKYMKEDGKC